MHERHDLDLVFALAQGTLEDPAPGRELVDSCPECAEYYEANLLVLEAIRSEPAPRLTDLERFRLRQAVWAEVDSAEPETTPEVPVASSTPRWYRIMGAAAILAAFVAVGAVLVGGRGGATTLTTAAREVFSATAELQTQADTAEPFSGGGEDSSGSNTTPAAADTAMTEAAADDGAADAQAQSLGAFAAADLPEMIAQFTDRVVSGAAGTDSSFVCGDRVDATDVVATERAEMDGVPVWFVATGNPDDPAVQVLDAEDCSVVYPTG